MGAGSDFPSRTSNGFSTTLVHEAIIPDHPLWVLISPLFHPLTGAAVYDLGSATYSGKLNEFVVVLVVNGPVIGRARPGSNFHQNSVAVIKLFSPGQGCSSDNVINVAVDVSYPDVMYELAGVMYTICYSSLRKQQGKCGKTQ